MTLSNAAVTGSKLQLTQGVAAQGSASNAAFPKSLESYEVTFNITFSGVPGAATKKLFSYGPLIGKWNTAGTVTVDNGTITSTSATAPIVTAAATTKKYTVVARRVYFSTTAMSTFELFVDGVRCISTTGDGIANLDLTTTPALVLGGDTYTCVVSFDDVRVEAVTTPTNTLSDGAGVIVQGDGVKTGTTTEPNLWKMDAYTGSAPNFSTVDSVSALNLAYTASGTPGDIWLGDWFNKDILQPTSAANYGSGTSGAFQGVTVTSDTFLQNPKITAASAYIRLGSTSRQAMGQAITVDYVSFKNGLTNPGPGVYPAPSHSNGYFETMYGTANYLISNYSVTGVTRGSAGTGASVLVTGVVKPVTSFSAATGGSIGTNAGDPMTAPFTCGVATSVNSIKDMVELLTIGDPTTAGAYVSVWVWRGGRILMFNGTSYTETMNPIVSSSEFVLGVHLTATEPQLYINGVHRTGATNMLPWRSISGNVTTTVSAANTGALLSSTSTARGVYLGPRRTYDATGVAISAAYKNWRVVDTALNSMTTSQIADTQLYRYANEYDAGPITVTYGFRIGDDETLQIVKTQGSMANDTLLGNPLPISEDTGGALTVNSLGAIDSSSVDVVMEVYNKR
eukprot:jgi/Mesvir1/21659/Mv04080-RA.1